MTMRGARKDPIFITTNVSFTLPAAGTSVANGGTTLDITPSTDFETRTGRSLRNATVARIWLHGLYTVSAVVTTPAVSGFGLGAIVLTEKIEAVDLPELMLHAGDWMMHDERVLAQVSDSVDVKLMTPGSSGRAGAVVMLDNRSKRLIRRDTDKLFICCGKDTALEENTFFNGRVTVMWLVP